MKKHQRLIYDCPLAEPVYAEVASILCQSDEDLTFDSNINYNNPFGDSEGTID